MEDVLKEWRFHYGRDKPQSCGDLSLQFRALLFGVFVFWRPNCDAYGNHMGATYCMTDLMSYECPVNHQKCLHLVATACTWQGFQYQ